MSMSGARVLPYGEWPSPVSADHLVRGAAGISEVIADPRHPWLLWWAESRPDEAGRTAVMRCDLRGGDPEEFTPPDADVRTRVHEYGGGAWWPHDGSLYYADSADQRLRRIDGPDQQPRLLTGEPPEPAAWRYADGRVTPDGRWSVCVQELHDLSSGAEPTNRLAAVACDGSQRVVALWSDADFVMTPRVSPDGSKLAWISWDHPDMPWDATRLHVHEFDEARLGAELLVVGGGGDRSLCEPGWAETGGAGSRLMVCSDHEDWWGLYEVCLDSGSLLPAVTGDFDVATPPWVFGMQRWAAFPTAVAAVAGMASGDKILLNGRALDLPDSSISSLVAARDSDTGSDRQETAVVAYAGAGYRHEVEVVVLRVDRDGAVGREALRPSRPLDFDAGLLTEPEAITFVTGPAGDETAHALYYSPANPACAAPPGDLPPLLVTAHGGPTAAARRQLQLGIIYWTSRGIAVADVDYRGSTGYGRSYRRSLEGAWGVSDVQDCLAAARFLADRGDVDPDRLMIRGGSAGGFTVLSALAFHDTFAAGASRYGIADLEALAADTHKFESRYLDRLVGPYPQAAELYRARSPIHHIDGFDAPMIVLQGDQDEIVPPSQSEMIVKALKAKGVPVAYLLFEGEQHGFRKADNIVAAQQAELAFFGRVLGFTPADASVDLEISGL
ncbi:MAG: prolyl oligopeptidase family serine peptidase [Acidimicrobiaceae bacterium]|nr:prolyl oligopeptidase family serine peptidase [Acidimicrobiaceae bacterium]MCY4279148.1 prolyl oligopeptidase family serine peptidase [Acidimicrobiaceae bacterium]